MYINRLIPCLLVKNQELIKTIQFDNGRYLGDPINAVKIFNDREADELIILDITATRERKGPDFEYLKKITQQCFMPACYGGGVKSFDDAKMLFEIGFEKVSLNTSIYKNRQLIKQLVDEFGSQSIVGGIDVKKDKRGVYEVWIEDGKFNTHYDPIMYVREAEELGIGELFVNFIDYDGLMQGMDVNMITDITRNIAIPTIVCGGVGKLSDCSEAIKCGASAIACGSLFSYWGRNKAVLINYPSQEEIQAAIK